MTKRLLLDVDGVLLDWYTGFRWFMSEQGHEPLGTVPDCNAAEYYGWDHEQMSEKVLEFNTSDWRFGVLDAYEDVHDNLIKLRDAGYKFAAITKCSDNETSRLLRRSNLHHAFPDIDFGELHCVPHLHSKLPWLQQYEPSWWVEDQPQGILEGIEAGHKTILMNQLWNQSFSDSRCVRMKNWHDLANHILEHDGE